MDRRAFVFLVAAGCTTRPVEPPDLAAPPTVVTVVVQPEMAQPSPCTLTAAGGPVVSIPIPQLGANFYSGGLFRRREGRKVVQYGYVHPDPDAVDWSIYAREYDVSTWPPTALSAPTQVAGNEHFGPTYMFESAPGKLSAVWYTDGGGSLQGTLLTSVDGSNFSVGQPTILKQNSFWDFLPAVALRDGKSFAVLTVPTSGTDFTTSLNVFASDGTEVATQRLDQLPTQQMAFGQTKSNTFLLTAPAACSDAGVCLTASIDLWRLDDSYAPIKVRSLQPVGDFASVPVIVSDGDTHHFLTWWGGRSLFAQAIDDDGSAAAPIELWFEADPNKGGWFDLNSASVGPAGVVLPVVVSQQTANGFEEEAVLVQRPLTDGATVSVTPIPLSAGFFGFSTVQFDAPRALIVGARQIPGSDPFQSPGILAQYVCAEDGQ